MKNTTRQLTHAAIFVIKEVAGAAVGSGRPLGWGLDAFHKPKYRVRESHTTV